MKRPKKALKAFDNFLNGFWSGMIASANDDEDDLMEIDIICSSSYYKTLVIILFRNLLAKYGEDEVKAFAEDAFRMEGMKRGKKQ